ncbi:zinc-dependent alcohol dehydrogenase [Erwinia sp. MYb535]|uniref:zinc-dependent alcohol dehydrogenase n=1 Tax=Erwinia sp. MYb535 TaxID=2745309 RepID=UPI0030AF3027
MKTMKAAVVKAFGEPLVIEQVPIPEVGPGQLLVKVVATGVCHTDLHAAEGDWPVKPQPPFIPGHEGVGYVVAVGDGVKHIKEGDRVGVPWLYSACGHCEHCLDSWETLCHSQQNAGYSVNGSFAEYCLADANYVGILPDNIDYNEIAPILCAGVTVYKGLKMTEAKAGDWVVISGIGGLGHMAVQYAVAMGFNVAAVDIDDEKLAFVLNGLPPGKFDLSIFDMVLDGITVRGSIVGTRKDLQEALDFAGRHKVAANISVEPLANINDIFARMHAGGPVMSV